MESETKYVGGFIGAFVGFILFAMFFVMDWQTGEHGRLTITSVDKNLFGTYTVYARNTDSAYTAELSELQYCIDSDNAELANVAKQKIGVQNVTLVYPESRFGFYGFSKCHSAPIKEIR